MFSLYGNCHGLIPIVPNYRAIEGCYVTIKAEGLAFLRRSYNAFTVLRRL
jgi:hypothetical protein